MKSHGLVFDCDGTLVDSLGAAMESFNYALDKMGEPPRTEEEIKRYFGAGADRILTRLLGDEKKGLAAFELYVDHQSELALQMRLHDGVRELLERAAAAEVPMAVVTGRHARDLDVVLRPHKISDYFTALVADNHLPNSKPAPDGILLALKQMGMQAAQICYVGDSVMDMQAAHRAGSVAIAALWDPLVKPEAMLAEKPRFMAQTPKDVWTAFCDFAGRKL
ncbi:MAG: HAD family hydrolase [Bdellovibrionales bacterium]|nr:HAD family hydrolase [Bdellovibrionales bacterium]